MIVYPPVSGSGLDFILSLFSHIFSDDECERLITVLPQMHITLQVPFEDSVAAISVIPENIRGSNPGA